MGFNEAQCFFDLQKLDFNILLTKNNHDHPVGGDGKDFDFPERSGDSGAGYS